MMSFGGDWKDRPTADLIVLLLTVVVSVVIMFAVVGTMIADIFDSSINTGEILSKFGDIIGSILAVIIGYLGGRGVSSGEKDKHDGE
jgi:hypothetical protein